MRAVAVIAVILFHAGLGPARGGFVGVDIFFVISGFLITSILIGDLAKGRYSILRFYERRVRRILPALVLVLGAVAFAAFFLYQPNDFARFGRQLAASALFLANFEFYESANYFAPRAEELELLHLWSLAVEEQFYVLYPPLLWLLVRLCGLRSLPIALFIVGLGSLVLSIWAVFSFPAAGFYLLPMRAWQLVLGAILALGVLPAPGARHAQLIALAGMFAILASIFVYSPTTPFPGAAALLPCLGTAAIIYAGQHHGTTAVARLLAAPSAVAVGLISYSLYLWHWPILVMSAYYLDRNLTAIESAVAILAAFLLAILSWRFVEQPFRRRRGADKQIYRPLMMGGAALAAAGLAGFILVQTDGLPARVSRDVRLMQPTRNDEAHLVDCILVEDGAASPDRCPASMTVFVWGDSHAADQAAPLQTLFNPTAVGFYGAPGCPPVPGAIPVILPPADGRISQPPVEEAKHCRILNDAILSALLRRSNVKLVAIGAAWAFFTEGVELATNEGRFLVTQEGETPSVARSRELMEEKLPQLLETFAVRGVPVLLLGDVPQAVRSPTNCLAKAVMYARSKAPCAIPAGPALSRLAYSDRFLTWLAENSAARVFLPSRVLCRGPICDTRRGDVFMYLDADHLTASGARLLAPDMLRAVTGAAIAGEEAALTPERWPPPT